MTVPNEVPLVDYVGNGTTKEFNVPFQYETPSTLLISIDGVNPPTSDYSFNSNTGNFVFYTAPVSGAKVRIVRDTPEERNTDYDDNYNTFRPRTLNKDFDRLWRVIQEHLVSININKDGLAQEILDRIQADEDMLDYIMNQDNAIKQDYIQRDSVINTASIERDNRIEQESKDRDASINSSSIQRDTDLKNYIDNLIALITGDPSFNGITTDFVTEDGETQRQKNDKVKRGIANEYDPALTYQTGNIVLLNDGTEVISTIPNNTNDPNVDMTGWSLSDGSKALSKLNSQFLSVWDFFTQAQLAAYKANIMAYDAAPNIQAFFDYVCANDVGTAYCSGQFYVRSPILFGGISGCLTKEFVGYFKMTYHIEAPAIDTLLTIQTGTNVTWSGMINVNLNSANSLNYANRKVNTGIRLGGAYANTHFTIDAFFTENGAREFGIVFDNLTTGCNVGKVRTSRCGSGYEVAGYVPSLYSTFSLVSTNAGTTNQYSIIECTTIPTVSDDVPLQMVINGQAYLVIAHPATEGAGRYRIFPMLPSEVASGTVRWWFGGGMYVRGSDASVLNFGNISSSTCSTSLHLSALYPPTIASLTTQGNLCGLVLGNSLTAGFVGGSIGEVYFETLEFNVVQLARAGISFPILNNVAINLAKCHNLANYRKGDGTMDDSYPLGITTVIGNRSTPNQKTVNIGTTTVDMSSFDTLVLSRSTNSANRVVNLTMDNGDALRLFQTSTKTLVVESPNGNPAGSVTFNPPAGVTLNGGTTAVVYNGVKVFLLIAYNATTLFVIPMDNKNSTKVAYDPPALTAAGTAGESATTTVSLPGALIGSPVQAAFSQYNANIEISAQVSAVDSVTVKFKNTSAATVDLASGTLTVKLL